MGGGRRWRRKKNRVDLEREREREAKNAKSKKRLPREESKFLTRRSVALSDSLTVRPKSSSRLDCETARLPSQHADCSFVLFPACDSNRHCCAAVGVGCVVASCVAAGAVGMAGVGMAAAAGVSLTTLSIGRAGLFTNFNSLSSNPKAST